MRPPPLRLALAQLAQLALALALPALTVAQDDAGTCADPAPRPRAALCRRRQRCCGAQPRHLPASDSSPPSAYTSLV